jgi:ABC-type uncharacterized transport system involved in gliding motility auxiliary subunit
MQAGINPVLINVREKDQVKQQKAYMGAVVHYGDKKEVIPLIQSGSAMEYSLSTSIKKMTVANKQKVGILQGHGETSPNSLAQVMQSLAVLYDVEPVNLDGVSMSTAEFKTLVIINPVDSFPPAHLAKLDELLASGKNLCIAFNRVDGNLQTVSGTEIKTGLERWLETKGVKVSPNFIIDQNCGSVMVNQQQGGMQFQSNMRFPYLPVIAKFADHPVTRGLLPPDRPDRRRQKGPDQIPELPASHLPHHRNWHRTIPVEEKSEDATDE